MSPPCRASRFLRSGRCRSRQLYAALIGRRGTIRTVVRPFPVDRLKRLLPVMQLGGLASATGHSRSNGRDSHVREVRLCDEQSGGSSVSRPICWPGSVRHPVSSVDCTSPHPKNILSNCVRFRCETDYCGRPFSLSTLATELILSPADNNCTRRRYAGMRAPKQDRRDEVAVPPDESPGPAADRRRVAKRSHRPHHRATRPAGRRQATDFTVRYEQSLTGST